MPFILRDIMIVLKSIRNMYSNQNACFTFVSKRVSLKDVLWIPISSKFILLSFRKLKKNNYNGYEKFVWKILNIRLLNIIF